MPKPKKPTVQKSLTIADLAPDPANPNRMDAQDKTRMARALAEFGDLGGICLNRRTGLLIGGHQRTDVLRDGKLEVVDLPEPEPDGTVARGSIEHLGRRYALRVVDWAPDRAHAALLAANRFGRVGADDAAVLKDLLQELDTGATDMDLTGYSEHEIERLMTQHFVPPEEKKRADIERFEESADAPAPETQDEYDKIMDDAKMDGEAPIAPMYAEHHQAFVILCPDKIDETWLRNKLGLEAPLISYKDGKVRQANVATVAQLRKAFE